MRIKFSIFNCSLPRIFLRKTKFLILILFLIPIAVLLLPTTNYQLPTVYAQQSCFTQITNPRVTEGLISTSRFSDIGNTFGSGTGQCALGNQISFAPYKIPGYDDLKSIYFDQSKLPPAQKIILTGTQTQNTLTNPIDLSQ